MAVYEYEHESRPCRLGKTFEWEQAMSEAPLAKCPQCGRPVKRLISAPHLSFPKGDAELKSQGFTKLVRKEKGVYENVTRRDGEHREVRIGDHQTYPAKIRDRKND